MGLPSFKSEYENFIQQSLPLGLGSIYLFFPLSGLGDGLVSSICRKRQHGKKNTTPIQQGTLIL
jgi:hypothetical protein